MLCHSWKAYSQFLIKRRLVKYPHLQTTYQKISKPTPHQSSPTKSSLFNQGQHIVSSKKVPQ